MSADEPDGPSPPKKPGSGAPPVRSRGLGKGLAALLGETRADLGSEGDGQGSQIADNTIAIDLLRPNPYQPRRNFDEAELDSLAASIRQNGVVQPLLVRPAPSGQAGYEIIAGERRWRAAQRAGLHDIPVAVRWINDHQALEIALVENLQRQDLNALEEAAAYQRLIDEFGHTQEIVAQALGKSRSHVANMIRLLGLPDPVKAMVEHGDLTMGHARALLNTPDPVALAQKIVARGLNVRQAEHLAQSPDKPRRAATQAAADPNIRALEENLSVRLGLKVAIRTSGESGSVTFRYESLEQLDELLNRLR